MDLIKLKQLLLDRNNNLSNDQRWTSNIREEFKVNLENKSVISNKYKTITEVGIQAVDKSNKDVMTYIQSKEVSGLSNVSNIENNTLLPSYSETINNLNQIKIIGITGSRGKSTTAFLVHEYLKALGKKSILYSSIRIDSPASYINVNEPCEVPVLNENTLLDIIEEAESYQAEYIVMEVNEGTIQKGLVKDIPFTVRALTNLDPNHNLEIYTSDEYVRLKESFFTNIPENEECTCVLGLTGTLSRDDFNRLLKLNNKPKITFGSKYISELRNADYTNLDCLLYEMNSDLNGIELKVRVKESSHNFKTNLILNHNALNITCAISIIEALGFFDASLFANYISNINVPGREEIIKYKDRTIIIGVSLNPALENFKRYKQNSGVNKIKVVLGSIGTGFESWSKEFNSNLFISKRSYTRNYAMNYLKKYADYAYITSNDNAAEDPYNIAKELQGYLNNEIPSQIIIDREDAIKKAILESEPNDIIYIAGRGNRRIFCNSKNTVKLIQDKETVEDVLGNL